MKSLITIAMTLAFSNFASAFDFCERNPVLKSQVIFQLKYGFKALDFKATCKDVTSDHLLLFKELTLAPKLDGSCLNPMPFTDQDLQGFDNLGELNVHSLRCQENEMFSFAEIDIAPLKKDSLTRLFIDENTKVKGLQGTYANLIDLDVREEAFLANYGDTGEFAQSFPQLKNLRLTAYSSLQNYDKDFFTGLTLDSLKIDVVGYELMLGFKGSAKEIAIFNQANLTKTYKDTSFINFQLGEDVKVQKLKLTNAQLSNLGDSANPFVESLNVYLDENLETFYDPRYIHKGNFPNLTDFELLTADRFHPRVEIAASSQLERIILGGEGNFSGFHGVRIESSPELQWLRLSVSKDASLTVDELPKLEEIQIFSEKHPIELSKFDLELTAVKEKAPNFSVVRNCNPELIEPNSEMWKEIQSLESQGVKYLNFCQ